MGNLAFIGLGVMGFPMAGHLAKAGHNLKVYNRNPHKSKKWRSEFGGQIAATPAEAAEGADFVMCCVGNDDDLREVTIGVNGAFSKIGKGSVFVDRFDANSYLYITRAMDYFDLVKQFNGNLSDAFKKTKAKFFIISFTSDWLYPPHGNREVVEALLRLGKDATYAELAMDFGHDSFLVRAPKLYELIHCFLSR